MSQEEQSEVTIQSIAGAAMFAYCDSKGIPRVLAAELGFDDNFEVKRLAREMAKALTRQVMETAGPRLIDFWTRRGCPEFPSSPE